MSMVLSTTAEVAVFTCVHSTSKHTDTLKSIYMIILVGVAPRSIRYSRQVLGVDSSNSGHADLPFH